MGTQTWFAVLNLKYLKFDITYLLKVVFKIQTFFKYIFVSYLKI